MSVLRPVVWGLLSWFDFTAAHEPADTCLLQHPSDFGSSEPQRTRPSENGALKEGGGTPLARTHLIVWQTSKVKPTDLMRHNRQFLPADAEFRWHSDSAMHKSVREIALVMDKEGLVSGACEAFHNLRPYAYRADLWRSMVLWMHGGLYLDHKLALLQPIESWLNLSTDELILPQDERHGKWMGGSPPVWNGLMYSKPRHPAWIAIIRHILDNIRERRYFTHSVDNGDPLAISGPIAYAHGLDLVQSSHLSARRDLVLVEHRKLPHCATILEKDVTYTIHLEVKGTGLPAVIEHPSLKIDRDDTTHYDFLFRAHQVYCDEPGPPCPEQGVPARLFCWA
mmetsp:Transcript_29870/g.55984  ORF Transcript_29870/g.55984 Transcript_29870/m.55984 type:complete len:338 (+) Transcript_29870:97-1110(+)